jgi:GNAT superfamily N-acetyltransferase
VNSRDYPAHIIEKMCAYFTAERFVELSSSRRIYVAEDRRVVGTVSRHGNKAYTLFADPGLAGLGIGHQLMQHVETLAAQDGYDYMETGASITAHGFYLKLGYTDVRESETELASTTSSVNPCHQPKHPVINRRRVCRSCRGSQVWPGWIYASCPAR